ncbi:MAG TPA: hypothetical protein PLV33_03580 [Opitutaceae bacterium]|mgnify:CR=1 FL=1|nr:hypothetical protein [Opitutaceae bacterium]HOR26062.1 hypothetical protein [Opitutaceae bacterium]HPK48436.1 hypothetical protein [Opitutaceae bacterium]
MNITFDSLVSGILGALLGVLSTIILYANDHLRSARSALRARLIDLKEVQPIRASGCNPPSAVERYEATYKEIWSLFLVYRESLLLSRRKKIDAAWSAYNGNNTGFLSGTFIAPNGASDVQKRVDSLLDAIGCKEKCP